MEITSIKDPLIIEARLLQTSLGRQTAQKFMLEGIEPILWSLESPCALEHVFVHDKQKNHPSVETLKKHNIPLFYASDGILKKITDTSYLVPFVGIAKFLKPVAKKEEFLVVLDGVKDFGNLGTIVRTAAAFGIREFISTEKDTDFFYKKTIDASRGTVFSSHLKRFASNLETIAYLKKHGYQIAVTTPHQSSVQGFIKPEKKPIAIVLGNETEGASQEMLDQADLKIQIPMSGPVESLNVAVAAGISLYEIKIKWVLAMLTKKIHESLGRNLALASTWVRLVFDKMLRDSTPLNATQAIMMMILKCDGVSNKEKLAQDAGLSHDPDAEMQPLLDQGLFIEKNNLLTLSPQGEEAIAKIWSIHESAEQTALKGLSEAEKENFTKTLEKITENCARIIPFE